MTNPAILEALAAVIGNGRLSNLTSNQIAAAVLELVGPRKLVWESMGHHMDGEADTTCRRYSIRYLDGVGHTWRCIDGGFGYSPSGKAAQAAAQAHADAAHWKNTKIGKLVGVV